MPSPKLSAATAAGGHRMRGAGAALPRTPRRPAATARSSACARAAALRQDGVRRGVTVENRRAVKVEGDQSSFQSSGNCCGKSQSSLQAAYHPDRIYHPMKRTNPKAREPGWQRITWDEAINHRLEVQGDHGSVRRSVHFQHVRLIRQWVYGPYAFYKWLFDFNAHGRPRSARARVASWAGSTRSTAPVDGAARQAARVRAVGHRARENSNYDDSCRNLVDRMSAAETHICIDPACPARARRPTTG